MCHHCVYSIEKRGIPERFVARCARQDIHGETTIHKIWSKLAEQEKTEWRLCCDRYRVHRNFLADLNASKEESFQRAHDGQKQDERDKKEGQRR